MPCVLCVVCFTPSSLAGDGDKGFVINGPGGDGTVFGVGLNRVDALIEAKAAFGGKKAVIELKSVAAQKRGKLPRT